MEIRGPIQRNKNRKPVLSRCSIKLADNRTIALTGKIDRVDREGDLYYIIDYKTGRSADVPSLKEFDLENRNEWLKTLKSVQLPSYLIVYLSNNPETTIENINAGFMFLGGKEIGVRYLFPMILPPLIKEMPTSHSRRQLLC